MVVLHVSDGYYSKMYYFSIGACIQLQWNLSIAVTHGAKYLALLDR